VPTSDTAPRITPSGLMWFLLTITTSIIVAMSAAWAKSIDTRQEKVEIQQIEVAKQFSVIITRLDILQKQQEKAEKALEKLVDGR
jgi:hypothetical protein